jgi:microcin C transport system ATP-binding protein
MSTLAKHPSPLLTVDDLSVNFQSPGRVVEAVKHVSFTINQGETVALVGESGSGKSVTALSVLQLLPYPTASHPSGRIQFDGEELMGADDVRMREIRGDRISMIFQEPMTSLNPLHSVERQINEVLLLHKGLSKDAARARTLELLNLVGILSPPAFGRAAPAGDDRHGFGKRARSSNCGRAHHGGRCDRTGANPQVAP